MQIQTQLFQVMVSDGTGIKQMDVDASRQNLQSQVNSFLAGLLPHNVLAVDFGASIVTSNSILLTAEVTYRG